MVLGTAQLGMDYGITNVSGKPGREAAFRILSTAWERGVVRFDTAPGYGSEELLGEFTRAHGIESSIRVLTKIPSLEGKSDYGDAIRRSIEDSLENLACSRIEVLFFHDASDSELLIRDLGFFNHLMESHPVADIGVSIYSPDEVDAVADCGLAPAFQFPYNVLDRRFDTAVMPEGKRYGRSILLQGLLAADIGSRPDIPQALRMIHADYFSQVTRLGYDPIACAISGAVSSLKVDYFLIGVETEAQLMEIVRSIQSIDPEHDLSGRIQMEVDPEWLDPRTWNQKEM